MTVKMYGSLADQAVGAELQKAQENPEEWTVYLVPARGKQRTAAQNKLFQVILSKLAAQQGRSVKYWRERLVEQFLGYIEVTTEDGDVRQVLTQTSSLSVPEFAQFLNACLAFAGDLQVH